MLNSFCSRVEPLGFNPNPLILDKELFPPFLCRQNISNVGCSCDVLRCQSRRCLHSEMIVHAVSTHDRQLVCSEQGARTGLYRHYLAFLHLNDSFNIIFYNIFIFPNHWHSMLGQSCIGLLNFGCLPGILSQEHASPVPCSAILSFSLSHLLL